MTVAAFVLAGIFALVGVTSGARSLRAVEAEASPGVRALVAVHDAAKAGFWLALGGLFLGFGLVEDDRSIQWFALVPIVMAGVRLLAAARLARR